MNRPRFKKEWLLYGLAGMGMSFATVTIAQSQPELERVAPRGPMNVAPYQNTIAATAIVEPASDAIRIVPEIDGRISDVLVEAGDHILAGDVLYRLEASLLQADLREAEATVARADAQVALRDSEIATARTALQGARLSATQSVKTVERYRPLLPDGISLDEFDQLIAETDKAIFKAQKAENDLRTATLQKAAAREDANIARAKVKTAQAKLAKATIRSSIDGQVLSVDLHPGDVVRFSQGQDAAVTVGTTRTLHLRTEIDETEAARFRPTQSAVAYLRGAGQQAIPLQFHAVEPILKRKSNFLSVSSERLDSRVLEVTYVLDMPRNAPIYVGQVVDVYINAAAPSDRLAQPAPIPQQRPSTRMLESNVAAQKPLGAQTTNYRAGEGNHSPSRLRD